MKHGWDYQDNYRDFLWTVVIGCDLSVHNKSTPGAMDVR